MYVKNICLNGIYCSIYFKLINACMFLFLFFGLCYFYLCIIAAFEAYIVRNAFHLYLILVNPDKCSNLVQNSQGHDPRYEMAHHRELSA